VNDLHDYIEAMANHTHMVGERLKAAPAKTRPIQRDLGWAAGFYEGEGSCFYSKTARSHRLVINQVEREPLERMIQYFGGHIHSIPARLRSQQSWRWQCYGARARGIALTLYALLSKKRQAQIRTFINAGEVRTRRRS
jgi:hypothetical protein